LAFNITGQREQRLFFIGVQRKWQIGGKQIEICT